MRSKDVVIGMRVKVHDITWEGTSCTFRELYGESPTQERVTYYVKKWSVEDRCWELSKTRHGYGQLYVMAKDFEPFVEE